MRIHRRLALAALLCTTATPGNAAPVTAFIGGFLNAFGAGTFLTTGAVGAWSAGFGAASFLSGSMLGRLLVAGALYGYQSHRQRRAQQRQADAQMSSIMVNKSQPVPFMERGYGRVRNGGFTGFSGFADGRRYNVILLAAQSTKGPVLHYLDQRVVEVDPVSSNVTTPPIFNGGRSFGSIRTYTGKPFQQPDARLEIFFREFLPAYDFAGLSYAVVECTRPPQELFQEIYPEGKDWDYAPVWDMGDTVLDPRTGIRGWTNNAALIIAAEAEFFGKDIDWAEVAAEADICDQMVTNREGQQQQRWTINCLLSDDMEWEDVRATFEVACDAWFYERPDGKLGFKVGRYIAPTLTLTDTDFVSLEIVESGFGPDEYGEFVVRYIEPSANFVENDSAPVVFVPGAPRQTEVCKAINSHNQACRAAKRIGTKTRSRYRFSGRIKLIGYEVIGERFVRIVHEGMGFDQVVEVASLERDDSGLTFSFVGQSVEPDDFDFNAAVEEGAQNIQSDALPDAQQAVPGPSAVQAVESKFVSRENVVKSKLTISWSAPVDPQTATYEVLTSVNGGPLSSRGVFSGTQMEITDPDLGAWVIHVRAVTSRGRFSVPAVQSATVNGLFDPPVALQGLTVQSAGGLAVLNWARSPDLDVLNGGQILVRHSRSGSPTWASAYEIAILPGAASQAVVPLLPGTYLVRAQDSSRQLGPVATVAAEGATALAFAPVMSITADPAFSGALTNAIVSGGGLRLANAPGGGVHASGSLVLATGLDFGSVRRVRLTADVEVTALATNDLIDSRTAPIDTWPLFDGPDGQETNIVIEVRTSQTSPSASPVWSAWGRVDRTEIAAWGVQARVRLQSTDPIVTPLVTRLRIHAEEVI